VVGVEDLSKEIALEKCAEKLNNYVLYSAVQYTIMLESQKDIHLQKRFRAFFITQYVSLIE